MSSQGNYINYKCVALPLTHKLYLLSTMLFSHTAVLVGSMKTDPLFAGKWPKISPLCATG